MSITARERTRDFIGIYDGVERDIIDRLSRYTENKFDLDTPLRKVLDDGGIGANVHAAKFGEELVRGYGFSLNAGSMNLDDYDVRRVVAEVSGFLIGGGSE